MVGRNNLKRMTQQVKSTKDRAGSADLAGDRVMIASIDSFPASDPPGWIEGKAHPGEGAPPSEGIDRPPRRRR